VACTECQLFGFTEEVVDVAIEFELTKVANWHQLFGPDLGGIEDVEFEVMLVLFWNDLDAKFPLWKCSVFDGFPQIFAVEIWVLSGNFESFVPDQRVYTKLGCEDELDEGALIFAVDQAIGVDSKTLHHSERPWDSAVRHGPRVHVSRFRVHVDEVPEVVVR
jgi:hypothetical protein